MKMGFVLAFICSLSWGGSALLINADGFGSCKFPGDTPRSIPMFEQTERLIQRLEKNYSGPVLSIATCFDLVESSILVSPMDAPEKTLKLSLEKFYQLYLNSLARLDSPEVHMVGFSHGGWVAAKLALITPSHIRIKQLSTLDPISFTECKQQDILNALNNPIAAFLMPSGCTKPLSDLKNQFATIKTKAEKWTNFFQKQFALLHSGEIQEAGRNIQLKYSLPIYKIHQAHTGIDNDPKVWDEVIKSVD